MPEIGYKYNVSKDELDELIKKTDLVHTIAILEKCFCKEEEVPDYFNFLSIMTNKISEWDKGRIFNLESEIRWEKNLNSFHVIWISDDRNITEGWKKESLKFKDERKILLWGERIEKKNEWYEKQIPKIFKYPVTGKGNKIYLLIIEYQLSGELYDSLIYRFKKVVTE